MIDRIKLYIINKFRKVTQNQKRRNKFNINYNTNINDKLKYLIKKCFCSCESRVNLLLYEYCVIKTHTQIIISVLNKFEDLI